VRFAGCTTDPAVRVKPEHATGAARPWLSVESRRCTPTALVARTPVRYMSVECDARSHMVSEMTDWRAEMIGGLSSG
jgi:hypothetical protein